MKGPFLMRRSLAFGLVNETGRDEDETDDDEAEFWGGRANVRDSNGERGETTLSWVCFCYYLKFLFQILILPTGIPYTSSLPGGAA